MEIAGAVALVTGGGSGIGRALALALAAEGATVVVCGRRAAPLAAVAAEHDRVHAHAADITADGAGEALVAAVVAAHGRLDLLVNNAGVQYEEQLGTPAYVPAHTAQQVAVNLTAPAALTHAALPHLRTRPAAAVVNVTSVLALTPKRTSPVYCATKAGLRSLTRALRYALADTAVRVVEVLPPMVATPMTAHRSGAGLPPERVAAATVAALRRDRDEVRVGVTRPLAWAERLAPSLVAAVMRRK